jgi:hypothetical protein
MKNFNKAITAVSLMVVFLAGCKEKKNEVPIPAATSNSIADFIKRNTTASQNFKVNVSHSDTTITGQKGTIVKIPKNAFVTMNGQPVNGEVTIEMKEIFSKSEMILSCIPTISDGKLLESGGEIYINATTAAGEPLKIDSIRNPTVQVPNNNNPQAGMTLFSGDQNGDKFNWKPVPVDSVIYTFNTLDTLSMIYHPFTSFVPVNGHYVFTLKNFGWTNCDRFWSSSNVTTIKVDCQKFNSYANVYVVFKNLKCAIQLHQSNDGLYSSDWEGLTNMPIGEEITIIAISVQDNKSYYTITDAAITQNLFVTLTLAESGESDMVNAIKQKCD